MCKKLYASEFSLSAINSLFKNVCCIKEINSKAFVHRYINKRISIMVYDYSIKIKYLFQTLDINSSQQQKSKLLTAEQNITAIEKDLK